MVFSPNLLQYSDSDKIQQTHFPGLQLKTVIVMEQFYKHNVYKHGHWDLYNKVPREGSKMYLMY